MIYTPDVVRSALEQFRADVESGLDKLTPGKLLGRKNPFLYAARNVITTHGLAKQLVEDWMTSSEETKFGKFFEAIAVQAPDADYSDAEGFDVVVRRAGSPARYYAIKSGPHVFNKQSRQRQIQHADSILSRRRELRAGADSVETLVGYAYGNKSGPLGPMRQVSGRALWEELFGDADYANRILNELHSFPIQWGEQRAQLIIAKASNVEPEFQNLIGGEDGTVDYARWFEVTSSGTIPKPRRKARTVSRPI